MKNVRLERVVVVNALWDAWELQKRKKTLKMKDYSSKSSDKYFTNV
jgi:hypothetical protein